MATCRNIHKFMAVEIEQDVNAEKFDKITNEGKPVILKHCDFGDCIKTWNIEYLNEKLADETVVIHESSNADLSFLDKNFSYKTCKFSQFVDKLLKSPGLGAESHIYLRSTSKNPRDKKPARIEQNFPILSQELRPPSFIPYGPKNELYHSSVLRIASANVQIWTHFDLYDNVLCQIQGTKRIVLLPPEDSQYLYVDGDKSRVNNFDNWQESLLQFPLVKHTKPYWCLLNPGDCIYIPALWWHNIRTVDEFDGKRQHSIGLNIFWKDAEIEEKSFYADVDIYGNKNLLPFDSAIVNLNRAVQHLNRLPGKYNSFYRHMALEQFKKKLFPEGED